MSVDRFWQKTDDRGQMTDVGCRRTEDSALGKELSALRKGLRTENFIIAGGVVRKIDLGNDIMTTMSPLGYSLPLR